MGDPKCTKTDATEIVWGKNVHECERKKKQDPSHSYKKRKMQSKQINY